MNKFLKNYTSDVPVSKTIYNIECVLIRCGVMGITKEYLPNQEVAAVLFHIEAPTGKVSVRLPVNVDAAQDALWMDYVGDDKLDEKGKFSDWGNRKRKTRADFRQQAERTAWKIIQDWIEVQMSMIQMKQADVIEVFLPYVLVSGGQSYYRMIEQGKFAGLLLGPAK